MWVNQNGFCSEIVKKLWPESEINDDSKEFLLVKLSTTVENGQLICKLLKRVTSY